MGNGRSIGRQPYFLTADFFPPNFPELPHLKPRFPAAQAEATFVSILPDLFRYAANIVFYLPRDEATISSSVLPSVPSLSVHPSVG